MNKEKNNQIILENNNEVGELIVDVYETDKEVVVIAPIAGIDGDNIDIALEQDILVIKGERINPATEKDRNYFVKECYFGPFEKEIILPEEVELSQIKANIDNGMLIIKLPKESINQHKIKIKKSA